MMPRCYILIGVLVLFAVLVTIKAAAEEAAEAEAQEIEEAAEKEELSSRRLQIIRVAKIIRGLFIQSQPECLPRAAVQCCNQGDVISVALCGVDFLRQNSRCVQNIQQIQIG